MSQKVLIAFDDSENALRAVDYAAKVLAKDCRVTLFSVVQDTASICDLQSPELTPYFKSQQDSFCILEQKKHELLNAAQAKAKAILVASGFQESQIRLKSEAKKKGNCAGHRGRGAGRLRPDRVGPPGAGRHQGTLHGERFPEGAQPGPGDPDSHRQLKRLRLLRASSIPIPVSAVVMWPQSSKRGAGWTSVR